MYESKSTWLSLATFALYQVFHKLGNRKANVMERFIKVLPKRIYPTEAMPAEILS